MVCMLIIILILYCWYEQCTIENEEIEELEKLTEQQCEKRTDKAA